MVPPQYARHHHIRIAITAHDDALARRENSEEQGAILLWARPKFGYFASRKKIHAPVGNVKAAALGRDVNRIWSRSELAGGLRTYLMSICCCSAERRKRTRRFAL
jgi:hypothetical protein